MAFAPRYINNTYQPVAEAAIRDPTECVVVQFRGPDAKQRAKYWQSQFGVWRNRCRDAVYQGLTTQRDRVTDEHWTVAVLTHQAASAKFEVLSGASGDLVDLTQYDEVLRARSAPLPGDEDLDIDDLPANPFEEPPQ